MEFENLLPLFNDLLSTIRSQVEECKSQRRIEPEVTLYTRWKVDEADATETGPRPSRSHLENIPRQNWLRARLWVSEQLKPCQPYLTFRTALAELVGKDVRQEVDSALSVLVAGTFEDQTFDTREVLESLVRAIEGRPVAAWSDIDVWGITLRAKTIHLHGGKCRALLRQLDIPDFEEESIRAIVKCCG
jgi:hypothetical protein